MTNLELVALAAVVCFVIGMFTGAATRGRAERRRATKRIVADDIARARVYQAIAEGQADELRQLKARPRRRGPYPPIRLLAYDPPTVRSVGPSVGPSDETGVEWWR